MPLVWAMQFVRWSLIFSRLAWNRGRGKVDHHWQDELGISELLKTSPFKDEFENMYGLQLK